MNPGSKSAQDRVNHDTYRRAHLVAGFPGGAEPS